MTKNPKWSKEEDDHLKNNYLVAKKEEILLNLLSRPWLGVKQRAKRIGIRKRKIGYSKYSFDYNYFDEINTESKAYWLGFIHRRRENPYFRRKFGSVLRPKPL